MQSPQKAERAFSSCDPGRRAAYLAALSSPLEKEATRLEAKATVSDNLTAASFLKFLEASIPQYGLCNIADFECGLGMRCIQAALWSEDSSVNGYDSNKNNIIRAAILAERMLCDTDRKPPFPPVPAPAYDFPDVNLPEFHHQDIMDVTRIKADLVMASWEGWSQQAKRKLGQLFSKCGAMYLVIFQAKCREPSLLLQDLGFPVLHLHHGVELRYRGGGKQKVHAYFWGSDANCMEDDCLPDSAEMPCCAPS